MKIIQLLSMILIGIGLQSGLQSMNFARRLFAYKKAAIAATALRLCSAYNVDDTSTVPDDILRLELKCSTSSQGKWQKFFVERKKNKTRHTSESPYAYFDTEDVIRVEAGPIDPTNVIWHNPLRGEFTQYFPEGLLYPNGFNRQSVPYNLNSILENKASGDIRNVKLSHNRVQGEFNKEKCSIAHSEFSTTIHCGRIKYEFWSQCDRRFSDLLTHDLHPFEHPTYSSKRKKNDIPVPVCEKYIPLKP